MSEFSRGKDFRKKTEFHLNKEQRRGQTSGQAGKSDKDGWFPREFSKRASLPLVTKEEKLQPTILIKSREGDRAVSPSSKASASTSRKDEPPQPVYQLQSKPSATESVVGPPDMVKSVKFLDIESYALTDTCADYLADQSDFLVIGIVGLQGVGKSTIMSLLANPRASDLEFAFPSQGEEELQTAVHMTNGIDMFVTRNRLILLDCQPVLCPSIQAKLFQQDASGKKLQHSEMNLDPANVEIQSLQLVTYLLSVCQLVIFVQDFWVDPEFIRFIQSGEMLKPSTPTSVDETVVDYFPHVLFVHNKAQPDEFNPDRIREMQDFYSKAFMSSRLQFQSGFGIANGEVDPSLTPDTCGENINLFLLPDMLPERDMCIGHLGFEECAVHLRNQVLSTPRLPLTHSTLTEKSWFHYSTKVWDGIKKSNFFTEYNRLLHTS